MTHDPKNRKVVVIRTYRSSLDPTTSKEKKTADLLVPASETLIHVAESSLELAPISSLEGSWRKATTKESCGSKQPKDDCPKSKTSELVVEPVALAISGVNLESSRLVESHQHLRELGRSNVRHWHFCLKSQSFYQYGRWLPSPHKEIVKQTSKNAGKKNKNKPKTVMSCFSSWFLGHFTGFQSQAAPKRYFPSRFTDSATCTTTARPGFYV